MKRRIIAIGLTIALIGVIGVVIVIKERSSVVPKNLLRQANFAIFYPANVSQIKIEEASFKYDRSLKQVSFIVELTNQKITFAEQSSPDSFAADPNFYPQFIQKLGGYATFSSINGRVDLTLPPQVNSETGVMNSRGTLLFAKASGNLNENTWRLLFNSLTYVQPK